MIALLKDYCNSICPLSNEALNAILEFSETKTFAAEEYILKPKQTANYAYFVADGLVRSYYLKNDEEITTKFLPQGSFITSIFSFYSRMPGNEFIKTITPATLVGLHYDNLQKLYHQFPEINFLGRVITEKYLFFLEIEIYNLRKQNAEEKYLFFLKHYPHIMQICPLKYIASYLSISVETLSRIRSKIADSDVH